MKMMKKITTILSLERTGASGTEGEMDNQKGVSLIETLVALSIVAMVAVAFIYAMGTVVETTPMVDEKSTGLSLAEDQLEYIHNQPYIPYDAFSGTPQYDIVSDIPTEYQIHVTVDSLDPKGNGLDEDDGLQRIIVQVECPQGSPVITLEGFKSAESL